MDGLTQDQFRRATLESADEDGKVFPPQVEFFARHSMLVRMVMDGLITNRSRHDQPFDWRITDKGRATLTKGQ